MKRLTLLETFYWHNNYKKDWVTTPTLSNSVEHFEKLQNAAYQYIINLVSLGENWHKTYEKEIEEISDFSNNNIFSQKQKKTLQKQVSEFVKIVKIELQLFLAKKNKEERINKIDKIIDSFLDANPTQQVICNNQNATRKNKERGRKTRTIDDYIKEGIDIRVLKEILHNYISKGSSGSNANIIIHSCYAIFFKEEPSAESISKEFEVSAEVIRENRREYKDRLIKRNGRTITEQGKKYDEIKLRNIKEEIVKEYEDKIATTVQE